MQAAALRQDQAVSAAADYDALREEIAIDQINGQRGPEGKLRRRQDPRTEMGESDLLDIGSVLHERLTRRYLRLR